MNAAAYIPFCGTPPLPAELWQRWILEPVLLIALGALLVLCSPRLLRRAPPAQRICFLAGWSVLALALVSPLCALSVALFSARAAQHMLLLVVAAPLLALAAPAVLGPARALRLGQWMSLPGRSAIPALAFAALLWGWHVPALYDATFRSDAVYWSMHLSLLASALPLWLQLLQPGTAALLPRVLLGFGTFMQMGLLGALLTLSPALLYEAHVTTTLAWGLEPLADQQLGGLIMWIPGCSSLLIAMLYGIYLGIRGTARTPAVAPADAGPN